MPTVIDSLLVRLGWSVDPKGLEGFAAKQQQAKLGLLALGAAATGAFYKVEEMMKGAAERMGGIQDFSEQMGMSARDVEALGKVASENESSLEGMEGALRGLTNMAIQADRHLGRGARVFESFGLSARDSNHHIKSADVLLGDIADKMQALGSPAERNTLGARLGMDPAMVLLLSKGRENFVRLREEALRANPFSASDYEAAELTEKGFRKAAAAATLLKNRIAVGLMPAVNDMLAKFIAWTKNPEKIRKLQEAMGYVATAAKWVASHFELILKAAAAVMALKIINHFVVLGIGLTKTVIAIGGVIKGFGIFRALLTGGLLGLVVLLAQDLWVFYQGGTSVTGWMLTKFPEAVDVMKVALDVLGAAFLAISAGSGPVGVFAFALGGIVIAALAIRDAWQPLIDWFKTSFDELEDRIVLLAKIATPAIWLVSKVTGKTDAWYGKEKGPRYSPERSGYTEEDFNKRMSAFRQRNVSGGGVLADMPSAGWRMDKPGGGVSNTTTTNVGAIHLHIKGSEKWTPAEAKQHAAEIQHELSRQQDAARTKHRNGAPGKAL
jgi:hypothetical protein